jgi:hypothetical protein
VTPSGLSIDLFVWMEAKGKYWHSYDFWMERPENGIPKKYYFKSCPKELLDAGTYKYEWEIEGAYLKIPKLYGSLLDYWYPNWYIPDENFGQSYALEIITLDSCRELCLQE